MNYTAKQATNGKAIYMEKELLLEKHIFQRKSSNEDHNIPSVVQRGLRKYVRWGQCNGAFKQGMAKKYILKKAAGHPLSCATSLYAPFMIFGTHTTTKHRGRAKRGTGGLWPPLFQQIIFLVCRV